MTPNWTSLHTIARFARIDSQTQIWENRLNQILGNRLRVPKLNPFFANRVRGAKNGESQVSGDSRESLARYEQ